MAGGDTMNVTGGCYCGRARYAAKLPSRDVTECHCSQCRKQSGHRYATALTRSADVNIEGEDKLTWFRASSDAERGFCTSCGSHLFWRSLKDDSIAILAASIDDSSEMRITRHIFVNDKGDYYAITDGLPQFHGYDTPAD